MNQPALTAMQRVLTALSHKEADRVPFVLPLTMHGARELGLPIKEYFSKASNVVEGLLRMRARYGHDLHLALFYAAIEAEAFGAETLFFEDGPPNAGAPVVTQARIPSLKPPVVEEHAPLLRVLQTLEGLKEKVGDTVPIVGVVVSPYSLPVMQMGFEAYLTLLHGDRGAFWQLMAVNETFCVEWANAQLRAGATAVVYFDPLASPTMVQRPLYLETGHVVASRTLGKIKGPVITHLASGVTLPVLDDLAATGTAVVGVSAQEDLAAVKRKCAGRMTVLGNLNAVEMRHWTAEETEHHVRRAIAQAGKGGGFILGDNHGEIPWQVPESVLDSISAAVNRWGRYPLEET